MPRSELQRLIFGNVLMKEKGLVVQDQNLVSRVRYTLSNVIEH